MHSSPNTKITTKFNDLSTSQSAFSASKAIQNALHNTADASPLSTSQTHNTAKHSLFSQKSYTRHKTPTGHTSRAHKHSHKPDKSTPPSANSDALSNKTSISPTPSTHSSTRSNKPATPSRLPPSPPCDTPTKTHICAPPGSVAYTAPRAASSTSNSSPSSAHSPTPSATSA